MEQYLLHNIIAIYLDWDRVERINAQKFKAIVIPLRHSEGDAHFAGRMMIQRAKDTGRQNNAHIHLMRSVANMNVAARVSGDVLVNTLISHPEGIEHTSSTGKTSQSMEFISRRLLGIRLDPTKRALRNYPAL
ncbi:hypothetical protein FSARC_10187 [Fusarium sarcochroum]|uniref:Uncharacterized protein n=1 Tax=Fusarium sarcochroum TaxID=1208366 RepID=A0A8H4TPD5_9HYPO|nr:hypothetical protein FSARC_10187 [Fusarium sarcochroum]